MRFKPATAAISPLTFFGSAIIALGLIAFASLRPSLAAGMFEAANRWITLEAGWFYLLSVGIFVIFLLGLAVSPMGRIKLGPDDSEPDYGYGTWVAMLFSAGMGIGIVFYGVAEPITHFTTPPDAVPRSPQAARDAMEITFFHWGVHAWAIYGLMGLALAYYGYRGGQPLAIRSAFRPLFGDRVNGPLGDVIDIFAVVGTLARSRRVPAQRQHELSVRPRTDPGDAAHPHRHRHRACHHHGRDRHRQRHQAAERRHHSRLLPADGPHTRAWPD